MTAGDAVKWAALWEGGWWLWRRAENTRVFNFAAARAATLGRKLLVVGAPDHRFLSSYGCGDMTTDLDPTSSCPNYQVWDGVSQMPITGQVVVFAPEFLEYVPDINAALAELNRVSGGEIYTVRVEPWTISGYLSPGILRTVPWDNGPLPPTVLPAPGLSATLSQIQAAAGGVLPSLQPLLATTPSPTAVQGLGLFRRR